MQGSVWTISGQCLALESISELGVLFLSRVAPVTVLVTMLVMLVLVLVLEPVKGIVYRF